MKCIAIYPEGEFYTLLIFCSKRKKIQTPIMLSFTKKELGTPEMQNIFYKYKDAIIASALPASKVWWTRVRIPIDHPSKRKKAVRLQLETLLPHCLDKILFNCVYSKNQEVLIFSILQEKLADYLLQWKTFFTTPEIITFAPIAVLKYVNYFYPEQKSFLAINFGIEELFFISQIDGEIGHIASLSVDLRYITEEKAAQAFDRIFEYFLLKEKKIQDILFTGNVSVAKRYKELIQKKFTVSFIKEKITAVSPKYATVFGIGLDVCRRDNKSLQFCKKNFFSPRSIEQLKQRFYTLASLSILCAFAISLWVFVNYKYKENDIRNTVKKEFLTSDTTKSVLSHMRELENTFNLSKKKFLWDKEPYKVSQLIEYLTTDTKITAQEFQDNIQITHLTYQLLDINLSTVQSQFRTRVDLQFTASSDRLANKFYQVIKTSSLLQKKTDITWNKQNDIYCITFYIT